MNTLHPLTGSI